METEAPRVMTWSMATYLSQLVVGFFGGTRGIQTGLLTCTDSWV